MNKKEQVLKFDSNCFTVDQLIDLSEKDKSHTASKKEQVLALRVNGRSVDEIAELLKISKRSVYYYISDNKTVHKLTVENYIKAVKTGYDTKDDLAKHFHVRKEKLLTFEKESGIIQLLIRYYYVQGKSLSEICKILHLRTESIQNIFHLPTIDKVRQDLNTILSIYAEMAEFGDRETVTYNELKKLIDKLQ